METTSEPVQNHGKRRSQDAKVGRLKYILQVQKQTQRDIEEIKLMQRTILAGLKGMFSFKQPMIEKVCCADDVDREILQMLYEAGGPGLLPKDLAARLNSYKVMRYQVSRRVLRMNKRLLKELGERVAEQRGWHWALTSFANEIWGEVETPVRPSDN